MNKRLSLAVIASAILGLTGCSQISEAVAEPPRTVPDGQTPDEYYQTGVHYKIAGWPEQARDALSRAIKADPDGEAGKKARVYLAAYIPLKVQTQDAIDQNIKAFNQMADGQDNEAIASFQKCIKEYPEFEWPYGNLGTLYIKAGRLKEAQATVQKALDFNPNYLNGWLRLARALEADGDKAGAIRCTERAIQIDPASVEAKGLKELLEQQSDQIGQ